jgi:serine/threonine protein kinase
MVAADPARLRRFEQEARAIAALSHPNILTIFDVGSSEPAYLVTELLEGDTLRALVDRGPLLWSRTIEIARQLLDGLAAAHARGIVHRDLKPDNVFLTRDHVVKILDFGLAKTRVVRFRSTMSRAPTPRFQEYCSAPSATWRRSSSEVARPMRGRTCSRWVRSCSSC